MNPSVVQREGGWPRILRCQKKHTGLKFVHFHHCLAIVSAPIGLGVSIWTSTLEGWLFKSVWTSKRDSLDDFPPSSSLLKPFWTASRSVALWVYVCLEKRWAKDVLLVTQPFSVWPTSVVSPKIWRSCFLLCIGLNFVSISYIFHGCGSSFIRK